MSSLKIDSQAARPTLKNKASVGDGIETIVQRVVARDGGQRAKEQGLPSQSMARVSAINIPAGSKGPAGGFDGASAAVGMSISDGSVTDQFALCLANGWLSMHRDRLWGGPGSHDHGGGYAMLWGSSAALGGTVGRYFPTEHIGVRAGGSVWLGASGRTTYNGPVDPQKKAPEGRPFTAMCDSLGVGARAGARPARPAARPDSGVDAAPPTLCQVSITRDRNGSWSTLGGCSFFGWLRLFLRIDQATGHGVRYTTHLDANSARQVEYESSHTTVRWFNNTLRAIGIKAELLTIPELSTPEQMCVGDTLEREISHETVMTSALGAMFLYGGKLDSSLGSLSVAVEKCADDQGTYLKVRIRPAGLRSDRLFALLPGGATADYAEHRQDTHILDLDFRLPEGAGRYKELVAFLTHPVSATEQQHVAAEHAELAARLVGDGSQGVTQKSGFHAVTTQTGSETSVRWFFFPTDYWKQFLPRGWCFGWGVAATDTDVAWHSVTAQGGEQSALYVHEQRRLLATHGEQRLSTQVALRQQGALEASVNPLHAGQTVGKGDKYGVPSLVMSVVHDHTWSNAADVQREIIQPLNTLFDLDLAAPQGASQCASRHVEVSLKFEEADFLALRRRGARVAGAEPLGLACTKLSLEKQAELALMLEKLAAIPEPAEMEGAKEGLKAALSALHDTCGWGRERTLTAENLALHTSLRRLAPVRAMVAAFASPPTLEDLNGLLGVLSTLKKTTPPPTAAEQGAVDATERALVAVLGARVGFVKALAEIVQQYVHGGHEESIGALNRLRRADGDPAVPRLELFSQSDAYARPVQLAETLRLRHRYRGVAASDDRAAIVKRFVDVDQVLREIMAARLMLTSDALLSEIARTDACRDLDDAEKNVRALVSIDRLDVAQRRALRKSLENTWWHSATEQRIIHCLDSAAPSADPGMPHGRLWHRADDFAKAVGAGMGAFDGPTFAAEKAALLTALLARRTWLQDDVLLANPHRLRELADVETMLQKVNRLRGDARAQAPHTVETVAAMTRAQQAVVRRRLAAAYILSRDERAVLQMLAAAHEEIPSEAEKRLKACQAADALKSEQAEDARTLLWQNFVRRPPVTRQTNAATLLLHFTALAQLQKLRSQERLSQLGEPVDNDPEMARYRNAVAMARRNWHPDVAAFLHRQLAKAAGTRELTAGERLLVDAAAAA